MFCEGCTLRGVRFPSLFLLVVLLGCGSVSASSPDGADSSTGGTGGDGLGAAGARAGASGAGGAAAGASGTDGTAGRGGAPCIDVNVTGFGLGQTCNGDAAASSGCHASCTRDGAHYVGCVEGSPYATACYSTCADCP